MRWRIVVFGTLGALATAFGLGLLAVPSLFLAFEPLEKLVTTLSETDPTTAMLVMVLVTGLYVAVAARSQPESETVSSLSVAEERFEAAAVTPPEAVTADRRTLAATLVDEDVHVAVEHGGGALLEVRSLLLTAATSAYAEATDTTQERARETVECGDWADDPVAAVFLAGPAGPAPTLVSRLRLWLTPERERKRRIERTLDAIERLQVGQQEGRP